MATTQRDYYEVLGLERDADLKSIKDAFHKLAMKYHPDRNKAPDAEVRFKEIAEAYAVLSDPDKRRQYDRSGFAGVADFTHEDLFGGLDFGDIFGDRGLGVDFGGGGIFDRLFRHGRPGPVRGRDIEVHLVIPLERVNTGGDETVRFARLVGCPACAGSGAQAGTEVRKCETCDGSGRSVTTREETQQRGNVRFQQITVCPNCQGRGTFTDEPCTTCHGRGQSEKEETLKVHVPMGVPDATSLRIKGHGMPSDDARGQPGDLYVVLTTAPDPRFQRAGADLWRGETLEVADVVTGTKLKVPTLDGELDVRIPPGTQPDEVLRLRGKGLPEFEGAGRGDLKLRIHVHIPEAVSAQEHALYEQIRALGQTKPQKKRWWKKT